MKTLTELLDAAGDTTDKQTAHSYGPHYDRWFAHLRGQPIRILELGVSMFGGGDLLAFAEFFFEAEIWAVDLTLQNLLPAVLLHPRIHVLNGDVYHDDIFPLYALRAPPFDLILDDCLHDPPHQVLALRRFWPMLRTGGLYVIEDVAQGAAAWLADQAAAITADQASITVLELYHQRPNCPDNGLIRLEKKLAEPAPASPIGDGSLKLLTPDS